MPLCVCVLQERSAGHLDAVDPGNGRLDGGRLQVSSPQSAQSGQSHFLVHHAARMRHHVRRGNDIRRRTRVNRAAQPIIDQYVDAKKDGENGP